MHKVISINLNGNAYQLDEDAYEALRAYLDRAQAALKDNPDRSEIMADLEQAIAEKCGRSLGPHKTVIVKSEVDQIIVEMGPVEGGQSDAATGAGGGREDQVRTETARPKRLYRIKEGAMFAGVCAGLAAYFDVDVTLIRVLFVIGSFLTSGVAILIYFVMMLVVPEASTSDERAAAYGMPFNAQEIVDGATRFAKGDRKAWKRQWKRRERQFRREWRSAMDDRRWRADDIPGAMFAGVMVPVFMIINLALFVVLWFAVHSLATTGGFSGWMIPAGMPFWVAVLLLIMLFGILTSPLSAARHISYRAYGHYPVFGVWSGVVWLGVVGGLIWFGSQHQPEIRDFIQSLPGMWNDIWTRFQQS